MMHNADVTPTRQSVLAGSTPARAIPPASATNRSVVTHTTPPAGPARFDGNPSANARPMAGPANNGNMNSAQSPAAGANANLGSAGHNVPRPPAANGTASYGSNPSARSGAPNNSTSQVARSDNPANPAANTVPVRRQATAASREETRSVNSHAPAGNPQQATPGVRLREIQLYRGRLPTTPTTRPAEPRSRRLRRISPRLRLMHLRASRIPGDRAMASATRPPASYSYHAAPAYSASSSYGAAARSNSGYYGGNARSSSPSSSYSGAGRAPIGGPDLHEAAATDRPRRTRAEAQRLRIRLPATPLQVIRVARAPVIAHPAGVADTARQVAEAAAIALPAAVAADTMAAVAVVRTPAAEVADIANRETRT